MSASAQLPADLILIHGKILTVDTRDSIAQAVAIREGKIIAVGSDQQIQPLAGPKTNVIDLHGRTATPGLIDTHAHTTPATPSRSPASPGGSAIPTPATIAVWDKGMYSIPSAELRNLKCEMTIYHGQIVYRTR